MKRITNLTKTLLCMLVFAVTITVIPALPVLADVSEPPRSMETSLVLKKGKTCLSVPFENDEPWLCVYKKTYTVSDIEVKDKNIVKAETWKKHWVNITGLKSGKTDIIITCKDGSVNTIHVRVINSKLDGNKYVTDIPTGLGVVPSLNVSYKSTDVARGYDITVPKYSHTCDNYNPFYEFVSQSEYNGIVKNEYRLKKKYCSYHPNDKNHTKTFNNIYIVRYGKYPIDTSKEYSLGCYDATRKYMLAFAENYGITDLEADYGQVMSSRYEKCTLDLIKAVPFKTKSASQDFWANEPSADGFTILGGVTEGNRAGYKNDGEFATAGGICDYSMRISQLYSFPGSEPSRARTNNFLQLTNID